MNNSEIHAQRQRIKYLFSCTRYFNDEPEMMSHWARYLCILASGYLENAINYYFSEFARTKSHEYVSNYVKDTLKDFMNPKMAKILALTESFSKEWKEKLESFVEGERKDAIDSIVANRNNIAHGRQIGLTVTRMKRYFDKSQEVVDFIKERVK